jgi:hypothetical protein
MTNEIPRTRPDAVWKIDKRERSGWDIKVLYPLTFLHVDKFRVFRYLGPRTEEWGIVGIKIISYCSLKESLWKHIIVKVTS